MLLEVTLLGDSRQVGLRHQGFHDAMHRTHDISRILNGL